MKSSSEAQPDKAVSESGLAACSDIAVVIPVYNYARFVGDAIRSAEAQSLRPAEIIVVDDGSTDDTPAVLAACGDRIRLVRQPNAGLSAARNKGLFLTDQPWVAFLDADDTWDREFLAVLRARARQLPKDFAVVAAQAYKVDLAGSRLVKNYREPQVSREVPVADLILKTRFVADAVIARTEVLRTLGGFDTALRSTEDRDMWIRVAGNGHRIFLEYNPLVCVREHATSMSRNAARMERNMVAVQKKARRLGSGPAHRWFWAKARAFLWFETALMYHDQGSRATAIQRLMGSMLLWPWFSDHEALNHPAWFRLRALYRGIFRSPGGALAAGAAQEAKS